MKLFLSSIPLLFLFPLQAQEPNSTGHYGDNNTINMIVNANTFFYDAEYATPIAKGYTVTGFRLSPSLSYDIALRLQLNIGFDATLFAGLDSLYRLRPTLSIIYSPTRWLTLIGGTINNNHEIPLPMFDPAKKIFDYQEEGLQILTHTHFWHSDTWLDWQHYLTPYTPDQEQFTMGSFHAFTLFHNSNFTFQNTLLSMAHHRGGELKTIDTNTVTTFNHRLSFNLSYNTGNKTIALDLPMYIYHLEDRKLDNPGYAFQPTISYQYSIRRMDSNTQNTDLNLAVGYWHGDHFFSAEGAPQFWSVNGYTSLHITPSNNLTDLTDTRDLVTIAVSVQHRFKSLTLRLLLDLFHDIDLNKNDLTVAFAMNFNLFKALR